MQGTTQVKDYYKILGVGKDADRAEIRRAYRKLAKQYHPDRNHDPQAEDRFKEIGEAYDVLKDEKKRAAYDQIRAGGPIPGMGGAGWSGEGFDFGGDNVEFGDLFETLFGGFARAGNRPQQRRRQPRRGSNLEAELELDLETAYRGGQRRITVGDASLDVKIPAGVTDGQKIRLKGQGQAGSGGAGDLILTINIKPHDRFSLSGRDLHTRINLAPWEAAVGGKIPIRTLSGAIEMTVQPGARSGQKLRAKGRGMPGSPPGDLIVELLIQTPKASSARIRELYEELKKASRFDPRD